MPSAYTRHAVHVDVTRRAVHVEVTRRALGVDPYDHTISSGTSFT